MLREHGRNGDGPIGRFEPFWSPWGITPCTYPTEVVAVVDRIPKADRWRGDGHLFGYPADEALATEANRLLAAYIEHRARMVDARSMMAELRRLNSRRDVGESG